MADGVPDSSLGLANYQGMAIETTNKSFVLYISFLTERLGNKRTLLHDSAKQCIQSITDSFVILFKSVLLLLEK